MDGSMYRFEGDPYRRLSLSTVLCMMLVPPRLCGTISRLSAIVDMRECVDVYASSDQSLAAF